MPRRWQLLLQSLQSLLGLGYLASACWQHYDGDLSQWPELRESGLLATIFEDPLERNYWSLIWQRLVDEGKPDSWAYRWTFTCLANSGLTAIPNCNLVMNVGFGADATNTTSGTSLSPTYNPLPAIYHPTFIIRNKDADRYTFQSAFIGINKLQMARFRFFISSLLRRLRLLNIARSVKSFFT